MIVIYAKCIVSGQNVEEFLQVAKELVEDTRKEPGNISYELIQCREGRNIYAFLERWPDQETLDLHMASRHFKEAVPKFGRVLTVPMEISTHEILI